MPQQQAPFLEGKYGWNFGESGWNTGMDENLLKFSFMFDGNVDSIVASLPPVSNGAAHFNTTDNRFYFGVGTVWYSSPCPKSFIFKIKSNGDFYQFNGTSAVKIDSPSETDSRLGAVELTVSSLGTAAFQNVEDFATQAELDVVEGQAQNYTDALRGDLADDTYPAKGAGLVGYAGGTVADALDQIGAEISRIWQFTPDQFKLPEDGTDDYPSFIRLAAAVNSAGAAVIRFLPGHTYNIERYRTASNGVVNIGFNDLSGLKLEGNGAKISIKGDFHRSVSTDRAVSLSLIGIQNLIAENLTLDGNVHLMTREAGLIETPGSGFYIQGGGSHLYLNCHSTRMSCDGFQVTANTDVSPYEIPKRVLLVNCTALENARQGVSVIGGVQVTSINCEWRDTGFAGGSYGWHLPGAGYWIEPNYDVPTVDSRTYMCVLDNDIISGNIGHSIGASGSLNNGRHLVNHCTITTAGVGTVQDSMFLGGQGWDFRDCTIDLVDASRPHINFATNNGNAVITFRGGSLRSNGSGLYHESAKALKWYVVEDVDLIGAHTEKPSAAGVSFDASAAPGTYFPQLQNLDRKGRFIGNRVFYPAAFYSGTGRVYCGHISGMVSQDNAFATDYAGDSTNYLSTVYSTCRKVDDYYRFFANGLTAGGSVLSVPWFQPARS